MEAVRWNPLRAPAGEIDPRTLDGNVLVLCNDQVFSWQSIFHRVLGNAHLWKNLRMLGFALVVNLHYPAVHPEKSSRPNIF